MCAIFNPATPTSPFCVQANLYCVCVICWLTWPLRGKNDPIFYSMAMTRMRWFFQSATYSLPSGPTAISVGYQNSAWAASPSE
jgi:hypothetical protein